MRYDFVLQFKYFKYLRGEIESVFMTEILKMSELLDWNNYRQSIYWKLYP